MNAKWRTALLVLALPIRVYLGLVFIWAAWYKIAQPQEFALGIATYDMLPSAWVNALAVMLPWVEIITGLTLILGWWTRPSALAISGMLIVFMVAIASALSRGLQMSCGCFASSEAGEEISGITLWRDGIWLAGSIAVLMLDDGRWGMDGWLARRRIRHADERIS